MTTHETSRFVRWAIILVLGLATLGMIVISIRANYLFGKGFGQTPEKAEVFGWANVAADIWKALGLLVIGSLWRARQRRLAMILAPLWLVCLLWGLVGAIGVYAQDRTALVGSRAASSATYADVQRELEEIGRKLGSLSTSRTAVQVDAMIAAVLARPVIVGERVRGTLGKLSADCSKQERSTAEACLEVAQLRAERAEAEESDRLRQRQSELRQRTAKLRETGAALPADPVAELFAWLSGGQFSVRDIAFGFPLMFAFLIELVSAFGLAGVVGYAEATRRSQKKPPETDVASHGELRLAPAGHGREGRIVDWMADRTEPTGESGGIAVEALQADYKVWCASKDVCAMKNQAFVEEFDHVRALPEVAGKIRRFGNRYYGIRLIGSNVARLIGSK